MSDQVGENPPAVISPATPMAAKAAAPQRLSRYRCCGRAAARASADTSIAAPGISDPRSWSDLAGLCQIGTVDGGSAPPTYPKTPAWGCCSRCRRTSPASPRWISTAYEITHRVHCRRVTRQPAISSVGRHRRRRRNHYIGVRGHDAYRQRDHGQRHTARQAERYAAARRERPIQPSAPTGLHESTHGG